MTPFPNGNAKKKQKKRIKVRNNNKTIFILKHNERSEALFGDFN